MIPAFNSDGLLPAGIHWATWKEFAKRFGLTPHRLRLIDGLRRAIEALIVAKCPTIYVDGSFVTDKEIPGDFDACWETVSVDPTLLDPVLLNFDNKRAAQKAKYLGELFPAQIPADKRGRIFLDFFQMEKTTGNPKGIIAIDLKKGLI